MPRGHIVLTTKWIYEVLLPQPAKMTSIRLLLSIAAAECLTLYQWDIKQAFLSAKLPYAVYVEPSEGLKDEG